MFNTISTPGEVSSRNTQGPFLTLSIRNEQSVSFGTYVPWEKKRVKGEGPSRDKNRVKGGGGPSTYIRRIRQ